MLVASSAVCSARCCAVTTVSPLIESAIAKAAVRLPVFFVVESTGVAGAQCEQVATATTATPDDTGWLYIAVVSGGS
jgi:hypothetical protein